MAISLSVRKAFLKASKGTAAEPYFDRFVDLIRPAISACPYELANKEFVSSRMGGLPDVPSHWIWPIGPEGPLRFMAQVDLADIQDLPAAIHLPPDGLLSFFFGPEMYGPSSAEDYAIAKVFHFTGNDLITPEQPLDSEVSTAFTLELEEHWDMPIDKDHFATASLYDAIPESEQSDFACALIDIGESCGAMKILGYPSREQNGFLQIECEAYTQGHDYKSMHSVSDQLAQTAGDWELLAEFYLAWPEVWPDGNNGYLHYWIRRSDLKNADFSNIAYTWELS